MVLPVSTCGVLVRGLRLASGYASCCRSSLLLPVIHSAPHTVIQLGRYRSTPSTNGLLISSALSVLVSVSFAIDGLKAGIIRFGHFKSGQHSSLKQTKQRRYSSAASSYLLKLVCPHLSFSLLSKAATVPKGLMAYLLLSICTYWLVIRS